jgi:hypothetical protein
MSDQEVLQQYLYEVVGEEGCGISCQEADLFQDSEGWKLRMEYFMEPWKLGSSVEEAKASIKEYASMGFGP